MKKIFVLGVERKLKMKYKFTKFGYSFHNHKATLKDRYILALHDPAYLLLCLILTLWVILG